jgi:PncC family amidohydrolase
MIERHFPIRRRKQTRRIYLCHVVQSQLDSFLRDVQNDHPDVKISVYPGLGILRIVFTVTRDFHRLDEWEREIRRAFPSHLYNAPSLHEAVHRVMTEHSQTLAVAESCTGGALAARIVSLPGASRFFLGGIVVYSNEWKEHFLQVRHITLEQYGAVSLETVREMVQGLFHHSTANWAIAISGIAGPHGGSSEKPVGTICLAIGERDGVLDTGVIHAPTLRSSAIEFTVQYALGALWRRIQYQALTFL